MKKVLLVLLILKLGIIASAQNNNSQPPYTCPTEISSHGNNSSSSSNSSINKSTSSCTNGNMKVLGNGVTKERCINTHSDGRITVKTTTCHHAGVNVNIGVAEFGAGSKSCTTEEKELRSSKSNNK